MSDTTNSATNYTPVEDGWKDQVKPSWVEVKSDYFNENSLIVELSFKFGAGFEQPRAKLPLLYGPGHKIAKFEDGRKSEHDATAADQREAFEFIAALWPAWVEYNKQGHTTSDMLHWFENEGRDTVLGTAVDIKVRHSQSGFPNANVKDPRRSKAKKEVVTKAEALTRAAAAFQQVFGVGASAGAVAEKKDESDIPF